MPYISLTILSIIHYHSYHALKPLSPFYPSYITIPMMPYISLTILSILHYHSYNALHLSHHSIHQLPYHSYHALHLSHHSIHHTLPFLSCLTSLSPFYPLCLTVPILTGAISYKHPKSLQDSRIKIPTCSHRMLTTWFLRPNLRLWRLLFLLSL